MIQIHLIDDKGCSGIAALQGGELNHTHFDFCARVWLEAFFDSESSESAAVETESAFADNLLGRQISKSILAPPCAPYSPPESESLSDLLNSKSDEYSEA